MRYERTVPSHVEPIFLRSLAGNPGDWSFGPTESPDWHVAGVAGEDQETLDAAIDGYDAAVLEREKGYRVEEVAGARKAAIIERFAFNGMPMTLDPDTENALSKAYAALERQPAGTAIDWEVSRGVFMPFDLPTVAAISDAAFSHVQACFTNAKRLTLEINAAPDLASLEAVDVDTGWPS